MTAAPRSSVDVRDAADPPNSPKTPPAPFLSVERLSFDAGQTPILRDVSFGVARGERVALVGLNGVGKTTALRCVGRLLETWRGEIRLDGVSVRRFARRDLAKKIAFVRQISGSFSSFTARQLVELSRLPYLRPLEPLSEADRAAVVDALARTGAERFAARTLDSLSGGERQKVLIAAAFAQEPELLLLDEPTTFLDYRSQAEISASISAWVADKNGTVLETTHDLNRAALDADRAVAFAQGTVAFDGPASELTSPSTLAAVFGVSFPTVPHPTTAVPMLVPAAVPAAVSAAVSAARSTSDQSR
ncbi:MAG: ABC transporter ATP-binding protein [Thermoguttaceae bacterium]|nr:ABC transporter ATP-binding protein [Thermoguttaceae bacterium]